MDDIQFSPDDDRRARCLHRSNHTYDALLPPPVPLTTDYQTLTGIVNGLTPSFGTRDVIMTIRST
jgi:hypothetical protein